MLISTPTSWVGGDWQHSYPADAGNAHTYGREFEIQALVTQKLGASLNTGRTHAALVSANPLDSFSIPERPLQDTKCLIMYLPV